MLRHGVSGKRDWCEESGCDDGAPSFGAYRMAARDGYGARHNGNPSRRARARHATCDGSRAASRGAGASRARRGERLPRRADLAV
ncbi:hypothetical protein BURMUCF1_1803 [Burkholderia multivorans ATCC BAA-247]|nr:hypothetical protein BURMUCF1_1803 [Burkholderia multivorans ATCC BAA-247]